MNNPESTRRKFLKHSSIGIGALALGAQSPPQDKTLTILCMGAHPGDPEFGCGGTLAKYSAEGHKVIILYLTRGEAGDPTKSYSASAALRTAEAEKSCKTLNATALFAGQIDGNTEFTNETSAAVTKIILAQKPDIVFTHWPLDTHKDHQVAGVITLNAWAQSGQSFHLYFYEVNTGDETMSFTPTDYVDITPYRQQKKDAMFAHKTQDPVVIYDKFFKTMEEFRGLEAGVGAAEGFIHFKPKKERTGLI